MADYKLPFPPVGRVNTRTMRQREYAELVKNTLAGPHRPLNCLCVARAVFNPPALDGFVRYDLDNLLKPTLDALKGIAYLDDNQVRCIHAAFGHREGDGSVDIRIEPLVSRAQIYTNTVNFQGGKKTR